MLPVVEIDMLLTCRFWNTRDCTGMVDDLRKSAGDIDLRTGRGKVSKMVGGRVLGLMCICSSFAEKLQLKIYWRDPTASMSTRDHSQ